MKTHIAQDMPEDVMHLMSEIAFPFEKVAHNCHGVSLALVRSGLYPGARVARGAARGVPGQHSWVVADGGPYDANAHIIDATLWSYDASVARVWQGTYHDGVHRPHGWGSVFGSIYPFNHGGPEIRLTVNFPLSPEASEFIREVGPLDYKGWHMVAHLPVFGWPAAEIIRAICETKALEGIVPIDIEGMLTDRNPGGLYL